MSWISLQKHGLQNQRDADSFLGLHTLCLSLLNYTVAEKILKGCLRELKALYMNTWHICARSRLVAILIISIVMWSVINARWSYLSDISAKKDHFLHTCQRKISLMRILRKTGLMNGFSGQSMIQLQLLLISFWKICPCLQYLWTYFIFLGVTADHSGPKWSGGQWMEKWEY